MKTSLLLTLWLASSTLAFAQGKLQFANDTSRLIYFTPDKSALALADANKVVGGYPLAGSGAYTGPGSTIAALAGSPTLVVDLYAGASAGSLSLYTTTTIDNYIREGQVVTRNCTFGPPGTPEYFQIQVHDSRDANAQWSQANGHYYGMTPVFTATPAAVPDPIYETTPPVNSTWPPGTFRLVDYSGTLGAIELKAALVDPPFFIYEPTNQVVGVGAPFSFSALAPEATAYQWRFNGTDITGATASVYTGSNAQLTNAGSYCVVATNYVGIETSSVAVLQVIPLPTITQPPASVTAAAGTVVNLSVSATSSAPLSYQWQNSSGAIAGATTDTFTLNPVQTNNADGYSVVVSNPYGSVTSAVATVTVYVPVSITTPPASQVVSAKGTVSLSVVAGGYPAPTYQWTLGGATLPGATASTLTITNLLWTDMGDYAVLVDNGYSSQLSAPATLSMAPSITTPFVGATAIWGRSAVLSVVAIGTGDLSYQWYQDGVAIDGATSATLSFASIQLTNGGYYSVVVSSLLGSVTNSAQVVVNPANIALGMYAGITISGAAGNTYEIQYTTALQDTNSWVTLTNLTLQQPVELWVDTSTNATKQGRRNYRVLPGQ